MPKSLILVPTDLERRGLASHLSPALAASCSMELCGFGPVAAAARAADILARHTPDRVMLIGIAGRLTERLAIGEAYHFEAVACYGVGAGSGEGFLSAGGMGWPQWPGDPSDPVAAIGDMIPLSPSSTSPTAGLLLTACAASASDADVTARQKLFPTAVAEDMEGFGVAMACRLAGVPLDIIRGISNTAGDRDPSRWQISPALAAAAKLACTILETPR
jgi:futalosine hydrolase